MRRPAPRSMLFLFMLILLLTASGCGFKDIDKRFFVVTIGVDKPEDSSKKYAVYVKLAIPSPQERFGSNQALIVKEEANSITEAVRIIKSKVDKELEFGHCKTIILGEAMIHSDITDMMDWFVRRRDIQKRGLGCGRQT
ncbi:Ger(x)C family spore germination protein [Paenibacillus hexagrammi]|uniref:Spore germination protein N-terminal domain-containing protein n=1 Tax=Paenibacillus hexagrammi TaxID=2908839 RepID=A0ABY3SGY8_9BACL|nr:hypothetical protein [Paenibacillus sp. YPD9-1]UJF32365.1 hypothetical protein L0M14_22065 [Paenibacillus sp. YPD9-1]